MIAMTTLSGCGSTQPTNHANDPRVPVMTNATSSLTIKPDPMTLSEQDFLQAYAAVRATFNDATPDRFLSLVDTSSSPPEQFEMFKKNWTNQEAKKTWTFFIPDLTQFPRLAYKQSGDWVAYYYERPSEETQSIDINIMRMHRINNEWKLSLASGASAIPEVQDKTVRAEMILHEIETSDVLTVDAR